MKKNKIEFFYPILTTIASIIVCTVFWDNIIATYSNPHEIIGEYSKYSYSIYNDSIRYVFFILLPVISFFLVFFLLNKNNHNFDFSLKVFSFKKNLKKNENLNFKFLISYFLIVFFLFLFGDWNIYPLQLFEDGMPLSGSMLFKFNQEPWIDIYLNTGLFYDILNAKTAWTLTGHQTIGSYKFYIKVLNLFSFLLIIYFFYEIASQVFNQQVKIIFFSFLSITFLFLFKENELWREIPIIIFLISILKYLNTRNFFYIFIISFLSVFTLFWSLDRGFFIILPLIPFLLLVLINNKKDFIKFILSIAIIWLITIMLIGTNSFLNFLYHGKEIFSQHEYLNGLIHPQPFSDDPNSSRATKALLLIIINFIISMFLFFSKKNYFNNNTRILFIIFSIMNFLIYKSALSRSDGGHIKQATYFSIILFLVFIIFFTIIYLNKKKNFFKKNMMKENIVIFIFILIIFFSHIKSIENLFNFPKNIKNLIIQKDSQFIQNNHAELIVKLRPLLNDKDCIQTFSYDHSIFYLLKKKSCSKFFNLWVVGSKKNQQIYINELKQNQPEYILIDGPIKFQSLNERYPYISNYIKKEYSFYKRLYSWKILKKIN